jgi:hypothetical protein
MCEWDSSMGIFSHVLSLMTTLQKIGNINDVLAVALEKTQQHPECIAGSRIRQLYFKAVEWSSRPAPGQESIVPIDSPKEVPGLPEGLPYH